ncbi:MAG TPA: ADP-ribosylglycohydrolase family protein [Trebonia sp.]|nr:ADP-ribosylglycohydrolase family protein [Trebonia sp.]
MYPEEVFDLGDRIDGALTAYACGDALGVPWESAPGPKANPTASQIEQLAAREGWPRGATSDDTALTLLVAHHLADRDGDGDPAAFLADLADQAPGIRGLGPTTTAAIEHFRRVGEPAVAATKATNGAPMRALPIGWVMPHDQAERRRQVTIMMSRATHADPAALVAACVISACASWTLEGASPSLLQAAAVDEARAAARVVGTEPRLAEMLTRVSAGSWDPPVNGISLDPYETAAGVLWSATGATSLRNGLVSAVQLGGDTDTDTATALAGGLLGGKLTAEQVRAELPWHHLVVLPESESATAETAAALATARAIQSA